MEELCDQGHEPLAFLGGTFRGAQCNWAVGDKEAFPIVEVCRRNEHMLFRERGVLDLHRSPEPPLHFWDGCQVAQVDESHGGPPAAVGLGVEGL